MKKLNKIIDKIRKTFTRFPFVLSNCFIGSSAGILFVQIESNYSNSRAEEIFSNIVLLSLLGFPLFYLAQIISENEKFKRSFSIILSFIVIIFLAIMWFFLPDYMNYSEPDFVYLRFSIFTIVSYLTVFFAPFIFKKPENKKFWQYNKHVFFFGFLVAALISAILFAGTVGAMFVLDELFGINFHEEALFSVFLFIVGFIFSPILLSFIPKDIERLSEKSDYPKIIRIISQYILTPFSILYLLMLYAYSFRIIVIGQWPEGKIAVMIVVFSMFSIFTHIMIQPMVYEKIRWVKNYIKVLYLSIIPLVFVLFWAVKIRIDEYGVTENRYYLIILGLWLFGISSYFILSKKKQLSMIFYSLAALMLLTNFGPWSSFAVSRNNQIQELKEILERNEILVNGKIVKNEKREVSFEDSFRISRILDYLKPNHGYRSIEPWFGKSLQVMIGSYYHEDMKETDEKILKRYMSVVDLMEDELGLKYLNRYTDKYPKENQIDHCYISADNLDDAYNVTGFDVISGQTINLYSDKDYSSKDSLYIDEERYYFELEWDKKVSVKNNFKKEIALIDLGEFINEKFNEREKYGYDKLDDTDFLMFENEDLRMKMLFQKLSLEVNKDKEIIDYSFSFKVLLDYK